MLLVIYWVEDQLFNPLVRAWLNMYDLLLDIGH